MGRALSHLAALLTVLLPTRGCYARCSCQLALEHNHVCACVEKKAQETVEFSLRSEIYLAGKEKRTMGKPTEGFKAATSHTDVCLPHESNLSERLVQNKPVGALSSFSITNAAVSP